MSNYNTVKHSYSTDEDEPSKIVFDIDSIESFQQIIQSFPIVVIKIYGDFCNPCRMLKPKYDMLANKYENEFHLQKVIFLKENIEKVEDIHKPIISVVPTFFIYVKGQRHNVEKFSDIDIILQDLLHNQ
jgi:thiol-disulfide isomerase/thioredoxin